MTDNQLLCIAEEIGTPAFVFDTEQLCARMRAVRDIVGSSVRLCYSIKANPFLIPAMLTCVQDLEVCSPGELLICEHKHVPPERVLLSGVNKTLPDIQHALDAGVTRFTAESLRHVQLLEQAAAERGAQIPVLLRLTAGSQFGLDESDLLYALNNRAATPHLRFVGIHYFSGTQRKKLDSQRKELAKLTAFLEKIEREIGLRMEKLEYGPGLYYPYFANEDDSDTLAPLRELAPDLQAVAARVELTIEMGRFFASECGTYLTRVEDIKDNCGLRYVILDGGIHHVNYLGGNMGLRLPRIRHIAPRALCGEARDVVLCGSLCTTADILVRSAQMTDLRIGDLLAFTAIGAYSVTEAPALFLSRTMPRIALRDERGVTLVRGPIESAQLNQGL